MTIKKSKPRKERNPRSKAAPVTKVIRIDGEVWQCIKDRGEPLSDSPNEVLRKLFKLKNIDPTGEGRWSYQARLRRLGLALRESEGEVNADVRDELDSILFSFNQGIFA
jgi:hypothetical protein